MNGDVWMDMIRSRSLTSHTYNREAAEEIARKIRTEYYPEFRNLSERFSAIALAEETR
jgi:hypothetical protein